LRQTEREKKTQRIFCKETTPPESGKDLPVLDQSTGQPAKCSSAALFLLNKRRDVTGKGESNGQTGK
jgi:hypothetical protein